MGSEDTVRRFFDAMNAHDADAVAALVAPSIVIEMGPQRAEGVEAVRQIASDAGPGTLRSRVDILEITREGGRFELTARRVQHWTETNELASEERLQAVFHLDEQGLVTRAELNPKPLDE
jgi:limonene-1,2-epoxide hydrolase